MRVSTIVLGGAALVTAALSAGLLHRETLNLPAPPPRLGDDRLATPRRLTYRVDTATPGAINIVNQDPFRWTGVRVEVGDGNVSFHCPAPPAIGSGDTLIVEGRFCRSTEGRRPLHMCVVRVAATQGEIVSGHEPCRPVF